MNERVLVTGAAGSVGTALVARLRDAGAEHLCATDAGELDVTDAVRVAEVFDEFGPTLVYHLAGAKYAPEGEDDPETALLVNAVGTMNVVRAAEARAARVVMVSTCKACNPETVYGASKLIAERLTLNAGGWVARFYNVSESCGNVFETWAALPEAEPVPVAPCWRYFISLEQAVTLLEQIPGLSPGRYTVDPGRPRAMSDVARELYPGRETASIVPRRGDRVIEPRHASCETIQDLGGGIVRIVSTHDAPVREPVCA